MHKLYLEKKKIIIKNSWKKYLNLDSMAQRKKNVRIESDFLVRPNGPREIW